MLWSIRGAMSGVLLGVVRAYGLADAYSQAQANQLDLLAPGGIRVERYEGAEFPCPDCAADANDPHTEDCLLLVIP